MPERPFLVVALTVLTILGLLSTAIGGIRILINPTGPMGLPPFEYEGTIIALALSAPQAIFIYLFYMLRKSSLIWLYISFVPVVILSAIAGEWLTAAIWLIVGAAIWDYISHKKIDSQPLFT